MLLLIFPYGGFFVCFHCCSLFGCLFGMSFFSVILVCPFNLPFGGTIAIYVCHFGVLFWSTFWCNSQLLFSILVCPFGLLFLSAILVCPFVLPYGETFGEPFCLVCLLGQPFFSPILEGPFVVDFEFCLLVCLFVRHIPII